jgi:hypothetical protein
MEQMLQSKELHRRSYQQTHTHNIHKHTFIKCKMRKRRRVVEEPTICILLLYKSSTTILSQTHTHNIHKHAFIKCKMRKRRRVQVSVHVLPTMEQMLQSKELHRRSYQQTHTHNIHKHAFIKCKMRKRRRV